MTHGPTRAATTPEAQPRPFTTRLQMPRQPAAVSGAATLGSLGLLTFEHRGLWVPSPQCTDATHAGERVPFCGSWASFSSGCQPGVRLVPFLDWSVLASPPFGTIHHCQVAGGH